MKRREFILSAAAITAIGSILSCSRSNEAGPTPAIDTHTHFCDTSRPESVPWPPQVNTLLYSPVFPEAFRAV